ncbi:MAG: helix-hairpin-helix domain-containing protein [Bacteroidetes bacterium]|nr:helix-hairpin-helix domain-containing protein [Bacteroidota bacterium]
MDNQEIVKALTLFANLAELHKENPFKYNAFSASAFTLRKFKEPIESLSLDQLLAISGIGKNVAHVIVEYVNTRQFPALNALLQMTPPGLIELLKIKGLGPKKVGVIWKEMGIETVEELLDACRQNRLISAAGFGFKTQTSIQNSIEFLMGSAGKFHFARLMPYAEELLAGLRNTFSEARFEFTGTYRRFSDIVETLEIISTVNIFEQIGTSLWPNHSSHANTAKSIANPTPVSKQTKNNTPNNEPDNTPLQAEELDRLPCIGTWFLSNISGILRHELGFQAHILVVLEDDFDRMWFETSATPPHLQKLDYFSANWCGSEKETYKSKGIHYILPERREGLREFERPVDEEKLLQYAHLRGVIHNHSNYSDGLNSLEEMAEYAMNLGMEYLAICDHSKTAFYANGLSVERVWNQFEEIELLNKKLWPFKIFKGIESDILGNGDLDYEADLLAEFDLVVASVHSNLNMGQEKAMQRLIAAIENSFTTILGHPTGRLLLMREGYPIDHKTIIDACAHNNVAIELNANPYRLDIDWRHIDYAMEKGVMVSVNPDAHHKMGYLDMHFGVFSGRKGGLETVLTLNALSLPEFEAYLASRK